MAKEKSLLEEAIAEAKRVREAAIADATKRLEENLTPSIKEMLASKLEEELDLDENEEESLEENANSGFKEVKPKSTVEEAEEDEPEEKDDEEAPADDTPADDAPADDAPADEEPAEDAPADDDAAEGDPAAEKENDDDTPLKDITLGDLRTLIQDIVAAGQVPAEGGDLGADMDAGGVEGMGDEVPAGDLAATDAPEGEIEPAGEAGAEDMQDMPADSDPTDDDEEIDISEILRELEEEEKNADKKDICPKCGKPVGSAACNKICKENKANDIMPEDQTGKEHCKPANADSGKDQDQELEELKKENAELKEGLAKCTKTLKDVNLLNSKLLYTTRVLNRQGLSESQKVKAMKSLDEAKSPKEVKLIYNTLTESFKNNSNVIKEGRQTSRASRAAGKSTANNVIVESNDMVRRFQQLAGIIKD